MSSAAADDALTPLMGAEKLQRTVCVGEIKGKKEEEGEGVKFHGSTNHHI